MPQVLSHAPAWSPPQHAGRSVGAAGLSAEAPLWRLLRYSRAYRSDVLAASVFSLLNRLFDLTPPLLIGAGIDVVVERQSSFVSQLGISSTEGQLWAVAGASVLAWGLESVFQYLHECRWRLVAHSVQHDLRMDVFRQVQGLAPESFGEGGVAGAVCILNDDVNLLERFLECSANQLIQLVTSVALVGGMFLAFVPSVAWLTLVPVPVVVGVSLWFQRRLSPRYSAVRSHAGSLASELSLDLVGKSESATPTRVEATSLEYVRANHHAGRLSSAFVPLLRMVVVTAFAGMLIYGGQLALRGELALAMYPVVVFQTQSVLWPLVGLGNWLDHYRRAMASAARVLDLLELSRARGAQ